MASAAQLKKEESVLKYRNPPSHLQPFPSFSAPARHLEYRASRIGRGDKLPRTGLSLTPNIFPRFPGSRLVVSKAIS